MNSRQLERIRDLIKNIREELQTDSSGTYDISEAVSELHEVVTTSLKEAVWDEYIQSSRRTAK